MQAKTKERQIFFLHALLTNSLSVLNESRSDHLYFDWVHGLLFMDLGLTGRKWSHALLIRNEQSDGSSKIHLSSAAINVKSHGEMMMLY